MVVLFVTQSSDYQVVHLILPNITLTMTLPGFTCLNPTQMSDSFRQQKGLDVATQHL